MLLLLFRLYYAIGKLMKKQLCTLQFLKLVCSDRTHLKDNFEFLACRLILHSPVPLRSSPLYTCLPHPDITELLSCLKWGVQWYYPHIPPTPDWSLSAPLLSPDGQAAKIIVLNMPQFVCPIQSTSGGTQKLQHI